MKLTDKQKVLIDFLVKNGGTATVRQLIDFGKRNALFRDKYVPESIKQTLLWMLRKKIVYRIGDNFMLCSGKYVEQLIIK